MLKLFDKVYQGNMFELAISEGKCNAMDVVQKGVKDGQKEGVKKEMFLQMVQAAHLLTSLPWVFWITHCRPD